MLYVNCFLCCVLKCLYGAWQDGLVLNGIYDTNVNVILRTAFIRNGDLHWVTYTGGLTLDELFVIILVEC